MTPVKFPAVDYLAIGHLACDRTPTGNQLGGTVAYAALTAAALQQRAGIVTAIGKDVPLNMINHLPRAGIQVSTSTTFENAYTPTGRTQILHHHAPTLTAEMIPSPWLDTPLVHFGPIVHEIDPALFDCFPNAFIGLTPQGLLRQWDDDGQVSPRAWQEFANIVSRANAVVLSVEDVAGDEASIEVMAEVCPILVATRGAWGATLYLQGVPNHIPTTPASEVDATGAGDIFAATFFVRFYQNGDPVEAVRMANYLATCSVKRTGLNGIPTIEEIETFQSGKGLQPTLAQSTRS